MGRYKDGKSYKIGSWKDIIQMRGFSKEKLQLQILAKMIVSLC